jgi:hypothetical protein
MPEVPVSLIDKIIAYLCPKRADDAPVDVAAVLDAKAKAKAKGAGQDLDWRHSIVDLLKLVDMDSSYASRRQLADELRYDGPMEDSAEMNQWLHREVMRKLAENGGNVPDDLRERR